MSPASGATDATGKAGARGCDLAEIVTRLRPATVTIAGETEGVLIREVRFDHRRVEPAEQAGGRLIGDLFCCLPGELHDGHEFAGAARRNGAVAFVCERPLGGAVQGAVEILVEDGQARAAMAQAACACHGDPAARLVVVGVTGTNGKTTTTHLLASILDAHGWPTTVIGTLSGARTTPESPELQRQFDVALQEGARAVSMEVTSHALAQHRVDGYRHAVAVFTNLSPDHLDYHHTMEEYFEAKATLFTEEHAARAVVNADDPYGQRLAARTSIEVSTFSMADARDLEITRLGSTWRLGGHKVDFALTGVLNVRNALAAAGAARALGIGHSTIAEGLSAAAPVPGRFEPVENILGVHVIVDYAHTPAALSEALAAIGHDAGPDRTASAGKLIVVFGAGGDRDRTKRPQMGMEVSRLADIGVVTSDNPRHEDPAAIIAEVSAGWDGPAALQIEPDRRRAIAAALELAGPDDVVLVAGKGHETTQQIGDDLLDFDDRAVVRQEADRIARSRPAGAA